MSQTDGLTPFDIPLTGRCTTAVDPLLIGDNDFQSLKNMRYTDQGIKGVTGMSKINSAAMSYAEIKGGFHFKKDQPVESHVIIQTSDSGTSSSRLVKSDNTADIPEQDTFSTFLALDNDNPVRFSKAPQGAMAACNGSQNYIWGGNEYRCGYFIIYSPTTDLVKFDYSDIINNTLTDSLNVAVMKTNGGGIDSYTKGVWHFENNLTDSSGNSHTLTNNGIAFSTLSRFGTYSGYFNGSAYASIADHADFDLSGGIWCFDIQARPDSISSQRGLFCQATNANNYIYGFINTSGAVCLQIMSGGSQTLFFKTADDAIALVSYNHVAFVENGDNWYIFINGKLRASTSSAVRPANYTGFGLAVGAFFNASSSSEWFLGRLDEARISVGANRYSSDFSSPSGAYSSSSACYAYVGSTRPIKGAKFHVETANTSAATVASNYWDGTTWQAVTDIIDNTSSGGKSLAQTGTVAFSDTKSIAKTKIYSNSMAYWYQFIFTGIDETTTVSRVTLDAEIQTIKDIWDGIPRSIMSFFTYTTSTTSYNDYSTNVLYEDYDSTDEGTYANIGGLTSSNYILAGFSEQITAVSFHFAGDKTNTTANTICSISYWDGSSWVSVGTIEDKTSEASKSMSKSGVIAWNAPSLDTEFTTSVSDETPIYYYRIFFDQTLSSDVYVDYVYGIPSQKTLGNYAFPLFWQDRLWLCSDQTDTKNAMKGSSYLSDCVFNGTDSPSISFDGDQSIVAGVPIFSRYGGSIYENLIVCKRNETYLVDTTTTTSTDTSTSTTSTNYRVYKVAANVGCVAPETMKLCDIGYQLAPGLNRHAAVWQSSSGIVMFDGNSIIPISDDIQNFFDPTSAEYINVDVVDKFYAFYDERNKCYHWLFATGTSTTLNKEWAYDLKRKKWFEVIRGTGKALQCGWSVQDSLGNEYVYGGISTGYIERLWNGTTMDGEDMQYSFRLSDRMFAKSAMYRSEIRYLRLTGKVKSTSAQKVTLTHYADGSTTGTSVTTIAQTGTGKRFYSVPQSVTFKAISHSIECSISTDDEMIGFEPLLVSGLIRVDKEAVVA